MLSKKSLQMTVLSTLALGTFALGMANFRSASGQATPDTSAKIESAMSAAPLSIAEHATILDNELDANGKFVVLREGTNGWYCSPDAAGTPGNDPWCYDQPWLDWSYAFYAGEAPVITTPGLAYMLQGGSDASNTDPFATEPAAGEEWMNTPPHIMVLVPASVDLTTYSTDHTSGQPWLMWPGTPYQHIMMPISPDEHQH